MSVWWKLAYILTPSISFATGFVLGITTIKVGPYASYWFEYSLRFNEPSVKPLAVTFSVFFRSLGWGLGLASISTIILTIILCIKKPWKSDK